MPPFAGCTCWTYDCDEINLPPQLKNGDRVSVLSEESNGRFRVRDGNGHVHEVFRIQIDCGYEFEVEPGKWKHEDDRLVGKKLRELVLQLPKLGGEALDLKSVEKEMNGIMRVLARQAPFSLT